MAEVTASEAAEDLKELRNLLEVATRPRVRKVLQDAITSIEKSQVQQVAGSAKPAVPQSTLLQRSSVPVTTPYTTVAGFAWDQDSKSVKVYISLEGASQDKAAADFAEQSADLKIHDVGGKNYRLTFPKLSKRISPEQSSVVVKPKRITLVLTKAEPGTWLDLQAKEDKLKKPKLDDKDPMSGIMDLMKNMYEDGDEEMKKSIAKAWSESRSGQLPAMGKPF
jgi:calcyclin binding protein